VRGLVASWPRRTLSSRTSRMMSETPAAHAGAMLRVRSRLAGGGGERWVGEREDGGLAHQGQGAQNLRYVLKP
jgi:hypothetical protein